MNVQKPTYFVKRVTPGQYRIVVGSAFHMVMKKGKYWFMNGRYFRTLRDAIIEVLL